jgi:hypothetical protein
MKFAPVLRRIALQLSASALLLGVPAAANASVSSASPNTGWIRMAHLSPQLTPMDVYLYSFGGSSTHIVLHHVAYGTTSPYESVAAGVYGVAMRTAGASPSSQPVLSASVTVTAGHAYTAAAVGPRSALRLQVLHDDLTTPAGKALVRIIQASVRQRVVMVSWDGKVIASKLPFASVTSYQAVSPGTEKVSVSAGGADVNSSVTLTAGSIHTLVVLDGAAGQEIANLEDAAGSSQAPAGGAQTGFGGTAPHGPGSPVPWLVLIGAGALLAASGAFRLRRGLRSDQRHAGA